MNAPLPDEVRRALESVTLDDKYSLARGRAFTNSRVMCNVHWLSDTEEGRTMASAVVAKLQSNPDFQADVEAAKAEVAAARAKVLMLAGDCAAEAVVVAAG